MDEIMVPVLSAAGGGALVTMLAKWLIQRWIERNDESHKANNSAIQEMRIQLTRVEERVGTLQRTEERTRAQDAILAVVQTQILELRNNLNGLGGKVREMQTA